MRTVCQIPLYDDWFNIFVIAVVSDGIKHVPHFSVCASSAFLFAFVVGSPELSVISGCLRCRLVLLYEHIVQIRTPRNAFSYRGCI